MANKRILTLGFFLALAWLGMLLRVAYVQVVKSGYYQAMAYSQSIQRNVVAPKRGEILDRDFKKLVVNAEVELESGTGSVSARIRKLNRVCPQGSLAGQVLGTVGKDGYGQLGLEYFLDRELRGTDGWKYIRHDVKNHYYPGFGERREDAINGMNVVLTLDSKLQEIVELALERGVKKSGAKQGIAIVVEPYSGDILAMANYPFYNPNTRDGEDKDAWKNQAVVKVYEPGSTFKAITATALLEEKLIRTQDTLDGENGVYQLANQTIKDTHPRGRISFTDAMAYSSNICFAKASTRLKAETFYKYIRSFGFGMKSGVGLPAEESGALKSVEEWSNRTQMTIAFGHEISATPIQVAMAFSAIANGGLLMRPRMVRGWSDAAGHTVEEVQPKTVRRVMSESTATVVKSMLTAVVEYGTAADIRTDRITLAGKTGTAEKIDPVTGHYVHGLFNSSFIGMAPVDHPELVCLVVVDEPSQLKYGGQSAAPIFREIVDRLLANPDYPLAQKAKKSLQIAGDSILVPDLQGYRIVDATKLLSNNRHVVQTQGNGDMVVGQAPLPGTRVAAGQTVTLSLGFLNTRVMPDLTNKTLRDAMLKLKDLGVEVEYTGNGRIIHQEPASGTPIRQGEKCQLTLGWVG